jgi:protein MPE1
MKKIRPTFPPQAPGQPRQIRPPPPGYVCYRCGVKGHFIQDCPTNGDTTFDRPKVKRTTGIPKSFLKEIDTGTQGFPSDTPAVMMNPEGKIVQFVSNEYVGHHFHGLIIF